MKTIISIVLIVWFVIVFLAGFAGFFVRSPGTPPLPILIGAVAPIIIFLILYFLWPSFMQYVLSINLPLATSIQGWRFAGLGFLALSANGILPWSFTWPAGLGDIAIGITAPWIVLCLIHKPDFIKSKIFLAWNLFGILDLINAVSVGGLNSFLASGAVGEITTAPMARMPLILIPAFFVPLFLMLHLAALFQAHRNK